MKSLPPGLQVDGLQVQSVLYRTADALHYRVVDTTLDRAFELEEFAPGEALAHRGADHRVAPLPGREQAFAEARDHFLARARATAGTDHPALSPVLRVFEANGTLYQLRPSFDGESLQDRMDRGERPEPDTVGAVLRELAGALAALHGQDQTHGALTPAALWVDDANRLLLRRASPPSFASDEDPYAAPEQASGSPEAGNAADLYRAAATLLAWLTGAPPPGAGERMAAQDAGDPDPLDAVLADISGGLGDALARALRLDPERRPASMEDWAQALDRIDWRLRMARETAPADVESERRPWLPIAIAAVVTLLMVAGGAFLLSDRELPVEAWLEDVDPGAERDRGPRVSAPTDEERARWDAALEADTLIGYRNFLEDFPTSVFADRARLQIDILDERAWERLSTEDSRPAYVDYLEQFPTGLHQAEALRRIEAIDEEAARRERERLERERRDNEAWAAAREARTIASMNRYIEAWPAGLHIEEAQRIRRALQDRANDDEAYRNATRIDTRDAFQAYIDAFPEGRHVADALASIERLTLAPGKPFRDCPVCPELRVMPVGAYAQGASPDDLLAREQERPQRVVNITRPFAVGIFEVTMGQWDACVEAGGCSHRPPDNGWGRGDRPVMMVSWNDAQEYVAWLSDKTGEIYRLPTESEWEYFARADEQTPWIGGAPEAVCAFGNVAGAETGFDWQHEACEDILPVGTAPVGAFRPNRAGLFDVIGNVAEWTADCMNLSYLDAPTDGSAWTRGICSSHMTRGGSWVTGSRDIRLSARFNLKNGDRNDFTGFRVVREIDE